MMIDPRRPFLRVTGLNAGYGRLPVLHDVTFVVGEGSLTTILGPNGAGKSTLVKSLVRLITIFRGDVWFGDTKISAREPHEIAGFGIGFVPQTGSVFPSMTVQENLEMGCRNVPPPGRARAIAGTYDRFPRLAQRKRQRASTLSGGERQMLAIGSALLCEPQLLILDEPITGLSPQLTDEVVEGIRDINRAGTTVLWVVEQNPQQVLAIADRAIVMEGGTIKLEEQAQTLLDAPNFRSLFLGV